MHTDDRGRPGRTAAGAIVGDVGWVTAGAMVANVCAYVVYLAAGRWWLSPADYSAYAVLTSAQLVLAVPGLAMQSVVAREVVRGCAPADLRRLTLRCAVAVAVLAAVASPAVAAITSTSVAASAAALASAPMLVVIGAGQGVAQGLRRFRQLAAMLAGVGLARLVPVMVALGVGAGPAGGLLAGSVGAACAAAGVAAAVSRPGLARWSGRVLSRWSSRAHSRRSGMAHSRRSSRAPASEASGSVSRPPTLLDVARAGQVQLVLIVASSVDLLLSRHVLAASVAGVYALGAIATKVAFWLPQAIGVVFYPRLANPASSRQSLRQAITVVAALGLVLTVAAGVVGPMVPILVTDDYRPLTGVLWLFAYTGSAMAVLQVALLSAIARDATSASVIAWLVVVVEVVVIVGASRGVGPVRLDSLVGLAVVAATAATVSALTTTVWCLRAAGRRGHPGAHVAAAAATRPPAGDADSAQDA